MAGDLVIRPNEQDEIATCSCCAGNPGVSGFVYRDEAPLAVYFAEPTGMINYSMLRLGIAIGRWGGGSVAADRLRAVFSCRPGPQLELIDPFLPSVPELAALGEGLFPANSEDHPQLGQLRALAAAIIEEDPRLTEMRNEGRAHRFTADGVPESGVRS